MKRTAIAVALCIILILSVPLSLICTGFCLPAQYGNTYYAVLPKMCKRLSETQGKRIVVVGNSAVAFALAGELVESEIEDYTVCPFGLYGAIGTKAMMDLSRADIREGDIVILAPEQSAQAQSLYFNGFYMWNALDGDFGLLGRLDWDNAGVMAGSFPAYAGRKFDYFRKGDAPNPTDVYAAASFNGDLQMVYDRPYNRLAGGYDATGLISFDRDIFSQEFCDYVNGYNKYIAEKGATLYYGFAPVNQAGIEPQTTVEDISEFYSYVRGKLDCEFLGNPFNYIMESGWFYDSNVHMNTAGSTVYTRQLVCDLKAVLGDSSPVNIEIPEVPQVPDDGQTGENGKDAAMFTYAPKSSGWTVTGLTEEGARAAVLELPDFYEGKKVLSFEPSVFAGDSAIESIYLGKNITNVASDSFVGCSNLKRLYMHPENSPADCHAALSGNIFSGAPDCKIYVPSAQVSDYINDYFWSKYTSRITGYDV